MEPPPASGTLVPWRLHAEDQAPPPASFKPSREGFQGLLGCSGGADQAADPRTSGPGSEGAAGSFFPSSRQKAAPRQPRRLFFPPPTLHGLLSSTLTSLLAKHAGFPTWHQLERRCNIFRRAKVVAISAHQGFGATPSWGGAAGRDPDPLRSDGLCPGWSAGSPGGSSRAPKHSCGVELRSGSCVGLAAAALLGLVPSRPPPQLRFPSPADSASDICPPSLTPCFYFQAPPDGASAGVAGGVTAAVGASAVILLSH